jgi:queuosine precursor transporter
MLEAFYYVGCMLQNILAIKAIYIGPCLIAMGGFLTPFTFMAGDIFCELYGREKANRIFTNACIMNLCFSLLLMVCSKITGTNAYIDDCFNTMLGNNIRFVLASCIAFYVGSWTNSYVMTETRGRYGVRAILSTLVGQTFDDLIFWVIAYAPIGIHVWEKSWSTILVGVVWSVIWETGVEAITVPFSKKYVERVKQHGCKTAEI